MHARSGAMPDRIWDRTVALSTAPIFDDAVYLSEALGLPINQNEDDLDAELALLARESGIHDPYRFVSPPQSISRAISTMTLDSDQRSSRSIHSQETQSTSFTSAPSRTSRDHLHSSERPSAKRVPPKLARSPQSAESYAQAIERPGSGVRSRQSSTPSITPSVLSSSSSQQAQPRRKRGSAIFSMFRRDSSACTSTSHHGHQTKPRGARLACGHLLSAYDVRTHIQEALQMGPQSVPKCCGTALPRSVLETVLTKEETDLVLENVVQLADASLFPDSGYSEAELSSDDSRQSSKSNALPDKAPRLPARRTRHEAINIGSALAHEAFKSFKVQQKEQFERVSAFECHQRKALSAHHKCTMQQLKAQYENDKIERMKQHTDHLERLEERQLLAEHDLLKAQAQETQNVATALKYMEAYCSGTKANHQEHVHAVSEEDLKKLDRQRSTQKGLPRKHASAINVLRARQELDTARKLETQEMELEQLDAEYEKEKATTEVKYKKEVEKLETVIEARRKRLLQRWDLRFEMWRRDWEEQHSMTLNVKLEHEEWPPRKADHAITVPESSSLAQYVKAAL
ncbi:hypothetical protein BDW02DRAFT_338103 [Decorospora gaudefroyi]|uniref:Uncharacterized protein n=1 Tax=Decorospora gaudefroyi TaxID=184978 RepID=A0A6A5KRN7_9PLEO|nr:hypothetical protein BDW02DRAFT_338103 [Decorospora gaudefroyi]